MTQEKRYSSIPYDELKDLIAHKTALEIIFNWGRDYIHYSDIKMIKRALGYEVEEYAE